MKLSSSTFRKIYWGTLLCYATIMVVVLVIAFMRPYGGAGVDASDLVFIRHKAQEEKLQAFKQNQLEIQKR